MRSGQIEQRSHVHKRDGATHLFVALDVSTGMVTGTCEDRHRLTAFPDQVEAALPAYLDLSLVLDNAAVPDRSS